jgi:hypothetical protein
MSMTAKDLNNLLGLLGASDDSLDVLSQKMDKTFNNRTDYFKVSTAARREGNRESGSR